MERDEGPLLEFWIASFQINRIVQINRQAKVVVKRDTRSKRCNQLLSRRLVKDRDVVPSLSGYADFTERMSKVAGIQRAAP